jgi:hypothetical protein
MKSMILALAAALIASAPVLADTPLDATARGFDAGVGPERTFATRAGHDWYLQQRRIIAELEAEHLLARLHEGDPSADGRLTDTELERIAEALADPQVIALLQNSAYYAAVIEGRTTILD